MILIDTDICIHILRKNKTVLARRREQTEDIGISFMTLAELYYGAEKSANPQKNRLVVEQFAMSVSVLESDDTTMRIIWPSEGPA